MARRPASVRARTTLGATAVVAVALVAAGLAVVLLLRSNLGGQADLEAEVAAREVASQLAAGTPFAALDLPDGEDHPVQVVDEWGQVRAASEDLRRIHGTGSPGVRPGRPPSGDDDDGGDDDPARGEVSGGDPDLSTGSDLARRVPVPGARNEIAGLAATTNATAGTSPCARPPAAALCSRCGCRPSEPAPLRPGHFRSWRAMTMRWIWLVPS
ncbi:hypothetical protein SAMN06265355_1111 [Actinomadura mexicana]|uniref:Uncharacterized protein n=1 Tax=Actinomadura mexicana TaxID=134959 RepID=A0A239BMK0_9ACTN|nr:hypothetical protein SAMN06265355_1111 [Actinomadura mexicana]